MDLMLRPQLQNPMLRPLLLALQDSMLRPLLLALQVPILRPLLLEPQDQMMKPLLLELVDQFKKQQLQQLLLRWRAIAWTRDVARSTTGWASASISPRTLTSWVSRESLTWRRATLTGSAGTPRRSCVTAVSA